MSVYVLDWHTPFARAKDISDNALNHHLVCALTPATAKLADHQKLLDTSLNIPHISCEPIENKH